MVKEKITGKHVLMSFGLLAYWLLVVGDLLNGGTVMKQQAVACGGGLLGWIAIHGFFALATVVCWVDTGTGLVGQMR